MEPAIPTYRVLMFPTLQVLEQSSGSLNKRELDAAVIDLCGISDEQLALSYPEGSKAKGSKLLHRLAFARSSLKLIGAAENSKRGVWAITAHGRELLGEGQAAVVRADAEMRKQLARKRDKDSRSAPERSDDVGVDDTALELDEVETEDAWRAELISALLSLSPGAFERLCAQLLREAGCEEVRVTRLVGDEGLDGVGVLRVGLLSFPVYFQAKRYSGSVGPEKVRELRGALAGRADKGILITTGRFTSAASDEAARAGAPIDLIDGERLCDLLLEYELGVCLRPVVDNNALSRFET